MNNLLFCRQNQTTALKQWNNLIAAVDTMCSASSSRIVSFLRPCFLLDIRAGSQAPSSSVQSTQVCWVLMSLNLCLAIHLFPQLCKGCLSLFPGFERWYSRGEQEKQCQFGNLKIKKMKPKLKQNQNPFWLFLCSTSIHTSKRGYGRPRNGIHSCSQKWTKFL